MAAHADAIVVGAGPNGLVAANVLADAGWDVLVLEAQPSPGGAVRTEELIEPGFRHDVFSSFYPLGAASPHLRRLALEDHGLRWRHGEAVVVDVEPGGTAAALFRDPELTAASVGAFAAGDREAWLRLSAVAARIGPHVIDALMAPFPPARPALRLARELGPSGLLAFARFGLLPVARHGEEEFAGEGAPRLLAGNALHADLTPATPGSAVFGWVLCGLGQAVGYPAAEGGAGRLTDALVTRLRSRGGQLRCGEEVVRVEVRAGAARAVHTRGGERLEARRAVLADVGAPALYCGLLAAEPLPARVRWGIERFQYDPSTVKVDWTLDGPIPWTHPDARRTGTIHVSGGMDGLMDYTGDLLRRRLPDAPFLVMGQYAPVDETRQPAGKETAWAYTHVPLGVWDDERDTEPFVAAIEARVEACAPGFRDLIRGRHVLTPAGFEARDANLVGGALNGGTAQLHQQLIFRPVPGLARPETHVAGLYLASASAHPGGGVHGACGANAAYAALQKAPRRVKTAGMVFTRMLRSRNTDQRSR
jgi:phytoene dehydrogenase-like protein